jgi:hypothetical protein
MFAMIYDGVVINRVQQFTMKIYSVYHMKKSLRPASFKAYMLFKGHLLHLLGFA